jgi:indolepyruvate ferredoxin oxidoreductase, alpha subunit
MRLMIGNEAIARGAYEAGVTLVSSYPGTPSTEITEFLAKYDEIYCEWATNEKVSVEVAYGASLAGARTLSAMKQVGLNVAADPLFTAAYLGVNGGFVIVVADDAGMHSSQNEQDSRNYAFAAKVPMLEPSDSQECIDFMGHAYEISEKYDTPVLIRTTTRTAHTQSIVKTSDRVAFSTKAYSKNIQKYVPVPSHSRNMHSKVEANLKKLSEESETSNLNKVEYVSSKIGVITSGISYMYVKEALPDASVLKLGLVHPLPVNLIKEFASHVDKLYVIEELDPMIEKHVKNIGVNCTGKEIFPKGGELSVAIIRNRILGVPFFESHIQTGDIPARPPVFCPGCPHRGTHLALKGLNVAMMGDIGCYTLGYLPPTETIDVCLCMGASFGMAHGIDKVSEMSENHPKAIGMLGDSTFIHSGITGIANIVYNKGTSTLIIVDNSITGMTGHQHNPTTGYTIKGKETHQIDLEQLIRALGVKRVQVVDPFEVMKLREVIIEEIKAEEPSVIIAKRPCVLLPNAKKRKVQKVDVNKCIMCKRCLSTMCPAIEESNGTIQINDSLCVGCSFCVQFCQFDALTGES